MPRKLCKKSNKLVRNANLLAGFLPFLVEIVPALKGETEEHAGNQVFPDAAHFVEDGIEGQGQAHEDEGRRRSLGRAVPGRRSVACSDLSNTLDDRSDVNFTKFEIMFYDIRKIGIIFVPGSVK